MRAPAFWSLDVHPCLPFERFAVSRDCVFRQAKARPVTTATKTELATKTKATKTELAPGPAWNFKEARNWEKVWYTLQGVKPKGFPKVTNPPTLGMCNGTHQSPIDVKNTKKFDHISVENKLKLAWYNATGFEWKSDGKELWLEGKGFEGSTTAFDGATYKLKKARFVSPGEHAFDGKQPPMEVRTSQALASAAK